MVKTQDKDLKANKRCSFFKGTIIQNNLKKSLPLSLQLLLEKKASGAKLQKQNNNCTQSVQAKQQPKYPSHHAGIDPILILIDV